MGNDLLLDGTASYDPNQSTGDSIAAYHWDLDNDGQFDDATWFPCDALPEIPPRISIARELIDWFVAQH